MIADVAYSNACYCNAVQLMICIVLSFSMIIILNVKKVNSTRQPVNYIDCLNFKNWFLTDWLAAWCLQYASVTQCYRLVKWWIHRVHSLSKSVHLSVCPFIHQLSSLSVSRLVGKLISWLVSRKYRCVQFFFIKSCCTLPNSSYILGLVMSHKYY